MRAAQLLKKSMYRHIAKIFLSTAVIAVALLAVRLWIVEPDEMAALCSAQSSLWQCQLRGVAIYGFSRQVFAPISLIAVLLAWVSGRSVFAILFAIVAVIAGMAGAVLYNFDLSALGLLLGVLLWARTLQRRQQRPTQQQA
ncbi:MAG: hypothetical protein QM808_07395 [Steroidobacteraceae bacterium]